MSKTILFLSALDFKEKSIQVIRKTPEAYVNANWDVNYIVVRDNSKYGNYFYENEINPVGVNIIRIYLPLQNIINKFGANKILRRILQKIAYFLAIFKLFNLANNFLKEKKIDIIYGYEIHGVLATNLLKLFGKLKGIKIVSRFQGTFIYEYFTKRMYKKIIGSFDHILALYLPSDLCIMTDDGTQGDKALEILKSNNLKNFRFFVNGVDEQKLSNDEIIKIQNVLNPNNDIVFLTLCRLEPWKRVERGLKAIAKLKQSYHINNFKYFIVGDGVEKDKLKIMVKELNLEKEVIFTGAIANQKVKEYFNIADFFISTYDSSNVGNPLLEAIRCNKIIFTLNNGDTNRWITHGENGFIYNIDENLSQNIAQDINNILIDKEYKQKILKSIRLTENNKLWVWNERLNFEIKCVEKLIA